MTRLFIVGAKRTPFGAFGGKLKNFSATELSYLATKAALASSNTPASAVDTVCVGNVQQTSPAAAYLARPLRTQADAFKSDRPLAVGRPGILMRCGAFKN